MNYDVPEIQDRELLIDCKVYIKPLKTYGRIQSKAHDGYWQIYIKSSGITVFYKREDFIHEPSTEWFLEQMKIKNYEDLKFILHVYMSKDRGNVIFIIDVKNMFFHLFMFKQGKILKDDKWVKI